LDLNWPLDFQVLFTLLPGILRSSTLDGKTREMILFVLISADPND
jgi:hypothetical protein